MKVNIKDKKQLGIIVGVVVVLLAGVYFFFGTKGKSTTSNQTLVEEEQFEKLSPEEIGLLLEARQDGKAFRFTIDKASDITSIEYEYTYDADSKEEEGIKVPKGGSSNEPIEPKGASYQSEYFFLGTCSSGTCVADIGVESVSLLLKVTKKDGKIFQVDGQLEL